MSLKRKLAVVEIFMKYGKGFFMKQFDVVFIDAIGYNKKIVEAESFEDVLKYLRADEKVIEIISISIRKC